MGVKRKGRFRRELRSSRWRIGPWFFFIGETGRQAYCWHSASGEYYGVSKSDGYLDQLLDSMESSQPGGHGHGSGPEGCDAIISDEIFHGLYGEPKMFTEIESWRQIPDLLR